MAPSCNGTGSTNLESEPKLAQVLGPESAEGFYPWKDCAPDRGECQKGRALSAKQPVQVILLRDAWSCLYFSRTGGAGVEWVLSGKLSPVVSNPPPPLRAWTGTWWPLRANRGPGSDRLAIALAAIDTPKVHGQGYWYGALVNGRPVVHFDGVHGESKPQGNYLRVEERDKSGYPSGCQVAIRLIGPCLVVLDNNRCGGLNVRFSGL